MTDAVVPVQNPAVTDSSLDAEQLTVSSVFVKRERIQLAGAAAAEIARVENSTPGGSDYGVVTRNIPSGTQTVDSELPAAAALANGATNPTTPMVGANAALHNGATWDLEQANSESTILASAARTATTNGADTTSRTAKGVLLILNVTAQPGGGETLSLKVQAKDSISGNYIDIADAAVLFTAATGTKLLYVHPGVVAADLPASGAAKAIPLPRTWRAVVTHSAGGSWTYSLSAVALR